MQCIWVTPFRAAGAGPAARDASGLRLSMRSIVGLMPFGDSSGPSKTGNLTVLIVGDMWAALANVLEWSTTSAMQVGCACQCGQSSGETALPMCSAVAARR